MKAMVKVLVPLSMVFAAFGAQAAGTIETDYPTNVQAPASVVTSVSTGAQAPHLVQSNNEGVKESGLSSSASARRAEAPGESGPSSGPASGANSAFEKGRIDFGYFA